MFVLVLTVKNGKSFLLRKSEKKRTRTRNNFPVKKNFSQRDRLTGRAPNMARGRSKWLLGEVLACFAAPRISRPTLNWNAWRKNVVLVRHERDQIEKNGYRHQKKRSPKPGKKTFFVSKSKDGPTGDKTNTKKTLIFKRRNNNGLFHIKCAQFFYMTGMPVSLI